MQNENQENNQGNTFSSVFSKGLDIASLFTKTGKVAKVISKVGGSMGPVILVMMIMILCSVCFFVFQSSMQAITTDNTYSYMIYSDFEDSGTPHLSPFGGVEFQQITADFHALDYYNSFGRWHQGIDLVPNAKYYKEDAGYLDYGDVLIYATCSGNAKSLKDSAGANYIYLTCDGNKHALLFVHNKTNLIEMNQQKKVTAGQPIAVMGSTGNSTGAHVHYAIKDLKTNSYIDPKLFMN